MAERRDWSAVILVVSVVALAVMFTLTYTTEYFEVFRGSWLVIFGWSLLTAAAVIALLTRRGMAPGLVIARNVVFTLGVIVVAASVGLAVWANNLFSWPLG